MKKEELIKNCILLNCLLYYDKLMPRNNRSLYDIISRSMRTSAWQEMMKQSPIAMTGDKPQTVIDELLASPHLSSLILREYTVGREIESLEHVTKINLTAGGPIAFCLESTDSKEIYFVYRGTARYEWLDNADGFLKEASTLQLHALDFFNRTVEKYGYDKDGYKIYATGHSKGGNKAQFVTIASPYTVTECINFDGQGFSKQFNKKYAEVISQRASIITTIAADNDYVNPLGNGIAGNQIMYQTNQAGTDFIAKTASGQALNTLSKSKGLGALFNFLDAHSPGAVFHVSGKKTALNNTKASACLVSKHLKELSQFIMDDFSNTDKKDCFYAIMSILSYSMNSGDTTMVISDEETIFSFDDVIRGLNVFISTAKKKGFHILAMVTALGRIGLTSAKKSASNSKTADKYVEIPDQIPSKMYQKSLYLQK